ncbi:DUF5985 family protein [Polyangium aurulentum]|uniref:DUF5985 family protein n=1 Tax=Polyangium aurulentum TaxID=2567896 RepID=UPI0010AEDA19|nr:DUF5985 family protein [Polyangium aurulentum]UQA57717.1 hypothetical protein E8A73_041620 [Polyangium aurulentum]
MKDFIGGALTIGFWVAALFFFKFWRKTHDRLFAIFSLAFWMMGANRVLITLVKTDEARFPFFYVVRLIAYVLIIYAIVDKNRASSRQSVADAE